MPTNKPSISPEEAAHWFEIYQQEGKSLRRASERIGKSAAWIGRQLRMHGYTIAAQGSGMNLQLKCQLDPDNAWVTDYADRQSLKVYINDCLRRFNRNYP
jgi:hypothetical protein